MKTNNRCGLCRKHGHNIRTCKKSRAGDRTVPFPQRAGKTGDNISPQHVTPASGKSGVGRFSVPTTFRTVTSSPNDKGTPFPDTVVPADDEGENYSVSDMEVLWELKNGNYGHSGGETLQWRTVDSEHLHELLTSLEPVQGGSSITATQWQAFLDKFHPAALYVTVLSYLSYAQDSRGMPTKMYYAIHDSLQGRVGADHLYHITVEEMCDIEKIPESFVIERILPNSAEEREENAEKMKKLTKNTHISGEVLEKIHHLTYRVLYNDAELSSTRNVRHQNVKKGYYEALANIIKHPNITPNLIDEYAVTAEHPPSRMFASPAFFASVYSNPALPKERVVKKFKQIRMSLQKMRAELKASGSSGVHPRTPEIFRTSAILDRLASNPNLPKGELVEYLNPDEDLTPLGVSGSKDNLYRTVDISQRVCNEYAVKLFHQKRWLSLSSILQNPNLSPEVAREVREGVENDVRTNRGLLDNAVVREILYAPPR